MRPVAATGPSPRVRGSRQGVRHGHLIVRTIPACAGEPSTSRSRSSARRDHPRVCGGAASVDISPPPKRGPSPRVRGSLRRARGVVQAPGTIPACAGEPGKGSFGTYLARDHPRVCGGARKAATVLGLVSGPSPRVRGSRGRDRRPDPRRGTIPACAGEPSAARRRRRTAKDHPRVCGGAARNDRTERVEAGPSPRVRGSPGIRLLFGPTQGTIPACAGEPRRRFDRLYGFGDHPRVCGGAGGRPWGHGPDGGPSPRVRGSLAPVDGWPKP